MMLDFNEDKYFSLAIIDFVQIEKTSNQKIADVKATEKTQSKQMDTTA